MRKGGKGDKKGEGGITRNSTLEDVHVMSLSVADDLLTSSNLAVTVYFREVRSHYELTNASDHDSFIQLLLSLLVSSAFCYYCVHNFNNFYHRMYGAPSWTKSMSKIRSSRCFDNWVFVPKIGVDISMITVVDVPIIGVDVPVVAIFNLRGAVQGVGLLLPCDIPDT